jgi:hypothetical protein
MNDDLLSSKEFGGTKVFFTHDDTMSKADPAEKKVSGSRPQTLHAALHCHLPRRLIIHLQEIDSGVLPEAFLMRSQVTNHSQEECLKSAVR